MTMPSAVKDESIGSPLHCLLEWNGKTTLEKFVVIFWSQTFTYLMTTNSTLWYIPKRNSCTFTVGNMYENVHRSTLHIAKAWSNAKTHQQESEWKTCGIVTQCIAYYISEKTNDYTINNIMLNLKKSSKITFNLFFLKLKPQNHTHTNMKRKSKVMNPHRNPNDGNFRWEETAEWYVEGDTWLYISYFRGPDFNFELWFHV